MNNSESGNAIFDELINTKNLNIETIVKDVQDLEQLESHLDHLEQAVRNGDQPLETMNSELQSLKQKYEIIKLQAKDRDHHIQALKQKIYIASVQYILSTQRCLSKDRHPLFGKGVLLDREE